MAQISYVSRADMYSKILMGVGGVGILLGIVNQFFRFGNISWFQLGLVIGIAGILVWTGEQIRGNGHAVAVWFLWGWGLSSLADLIMHTFFMLDIRNVTPSIGRWIDGSIQMGFFSIEPWWYFTFSTGFIGGVVIAGAIYTGWPRYNPYKWIMWPLLGGVVKSLYYGDVSRITGDLTQGFIGTQSGEAPWEWSSYWVEIYNSISGAGLPMSYISAGQDYAVVFALFAALHWGVYWIAGVVAGRWYTEY